MAPCTGPYWCKRSKLPQALAISGDTSYVEMLTNMRPMGQSLLPLDRTFPFLASWLQTVHTLAVLNCTFLFKDFNCFHTELAFEPREKGLFTQLI